MNYLIDPHGHFEDNALALSFFQGIVIVFLIGGIEFLNLLQVAVWVSFTSAEAFPALLREYGLQGLGYLLIGPFGWWLVLAFILYVPIRIFGVKLDYYDTLRITSLGLTPVLLVVIGEFVITTALIFSFEPPSLEIPIHALSNGYFGSTSGLAGTAMRVMSVLWAGVIWMAGLHQLGRLTPIKSILSTLIACIVLGG
ncbi:MAG: hypothetical protein ABEI86_03075, partial [Halobacteriaceae archaeon]